MIDDILVFTCLRMVHRQIHAASLLLFCFAFIYADIFRENDEGKRKFRYNALKQSDANDDTRDVLNDKRTDVYHVNDNTTFKRSKTHTAHLKSHKKRHRHDITRNKKRSKLPSNDLIRSRNKEKKKSKKRTKVDNTEKNYKKGEVFVLESSQMDDDDDDIDNNGIDDMDDSQDDDSSYEDTQEVTGERKETINHAAEDIVVDEDSSNNNNEMVTDPATLEAGDNDEVISDSMKDGLSTQFLESNQIIKTNEDKGNYIPVNNPSKNMLNSHQFEDGIRMQLDQQQEQLHQLQQQQKQLQQQQQQKTSPTEDAAHLQLAKALAKQLTTSMSSHGNELSFSSDITSPSADPAYSKSVSTDLAIDKSISKAIASQLEKDNELSQSQALQSMSAVKQPENETATGDFANIVEEAAKQNEEKNPNTVKPNSIFSPVSSENKPQNAFLENANEKLNSPLSNYNTAGQTVFKQESSDNGFDVNPGIGSLSPSEQQLISSIDNAVRTKDVATELATRIMMPTKTDTLSDRTVAPSEQLLDMLARGKFEKPLPDDVLTKLSNFNPNNLYLQEQGINAMQSPSLLSKQFTKVGSEYIPVHSIAVKMPQTTMKPFIEAQQLAKAELMMKTDPTFLAQNNQILDGAKYNSLQDLSKIGETMYPMNVVDLKQPLPAPSPQHAQPIGQYSPPPAAPRPVATQLVQPPHISETVKPLIDLPTDIAKILKEYRANKTEPKNFEDAISDPPNKNTDDHFVPEKTIRIAEEKKINGGPQCKWNPCLNGGMCTAHPDKYYCSCKPGYVGDNCEKRSNCFPNPCHHGTCWPNVEGYTCTCKVGYKGSKCDMLDRCRPNPCENNGICAETLRGVQCECTPGFKGRLCELEAKCEPVNPCMNGGTCREYSDHYHCSCSSGFRGQNCEEFVAPTKPPPTIPLKHEGPQAIPAPDNIPSNVIHELFAVHTADSNGNTETTFHESVGSDVDSNPGVVMVPHLANAGPLPNMESHNPFVGAPTQDSNDKFVFHSGDEDKNKPEEEPKKSKNVSSDSITGNDDRYQTHLVEVSKNKDTKGGVHVGKAIPETSEPISLGNPHPEDDSKADKVLSDAKLHTEKVKQEHTDKVNEINTKVHGTETGSVHSITSSDIHNDIHNTVIENADDTQTIVVKNANLHSEYERPTESGHVRSIVKSIENTNASSSTNSTNFINNEISTNNEPVNNATSSIVGKPLEKPSVVKQTINDIKVNQETKEENDKAINTVNQINKEIQNKASEAKQLAENEAAKVKANARLQAQRINNTPSNIMNNFTQQKSAYIEWRRKALKNYHKRNPDKPLPKNTLTLSKSSLCPEFCRTYCDPWCVGIGCCKTTKDQYAMYRKIEELKKAAAYKALIASKPAPNECDVCNENANCVNKHCICKTGFHGDGVTCSIDNCLLCHLDADCKSGRCFCKRGFFGDGYECRDDKYKTLCKKCHKNADCIGGDCLCSRGFYGNGRSCWPLPIIK